MIILNKDDLGTQLRRSNPDAPHYLTASIAQKVCEADHPAWGTDWEEWWALNQAEIVRQVAEDVFATLKANGLIVSGEVVKG